MTHHGFLASFSTSALLVSAAIAVLIVLGAVVAFNGFPGPSSDSSTETFTLEPQPAIVDTAAADGASFELIDPEPGPATAATGPPPVPPAAGVGAPSAGGPTASAGGGPPLEAVDPRVPTDPSAGPGPNGGGSNGGGANPIDRILNQDETQLGDPIRTLTGTLDSTLGTGDLLQGTTEPLSSTLDGTGTRLGL